MHGFIKSDRRLNIACVVYIEAAAENVAVCSMRRVNASNDTMPPILTGVARGNKVEEVMAAWRRLAAILIVVLSATNLLTRMREKSGGLPR